MTPETKAKIAEKWKWFRGALITQGHHVRAASWVVIDAAWQLTLREPGGPGAVLSWSAKRWAYAMGETLLPAALLWLRAGDKTPSPDEMVAAVEKRMAERGTKPPGA